MPLIPAELRCEYAVNPLGVDSPAPHLSWTLQCSEMGQRQTAYEIQAKSAGRLLWDSGKVVSGETGQIAYHGSPLVSAQPVAWKVRVWDGNGKPSLWSQSAEWTMGLLSPADWQAQWIGAPPTLGKLLVYADPLIGYHAAEAVHQNDLKWVQVDLGKACLISSVRLYPMQHAGKDGFGFPLRFQVEAAEDPDFQHPVMIADETGADYANPGAAPVTFTVSPMTARYVRVTATKLWLRDTVYAFALRRLEVDSEGRDAAAGADVAARDSVEDYGWGRAGLTETETAPDARRDSLLLRRTLTTRPHLTRALAFVCGLGQYELSVNGRKVGTDVLAPGWTKYDKTCLYDTRDITAYLHEGANAVGLLLGNGMYNIHGGRYTKFTGSFGSQKAICQLRLEYADGSTQLIGSDGVWRVAAGPITFSSPYGGEDYDARLLPLGWDRPGFADNHWEQAQTLNGPGGVLRGLESAGPPIKVWETFHPVAIKMLRPGVAVYDLGQNAAFMPRLTVTGPAGASVKITPAELIHADGSVDRVSVGGGEAYWKYTLRGSGKETYFPKFFYHGCRYLQVELNAPDGMALPVVQSLTGVVIGSASPSISQFECSNALFNRISALVRWAQRSNMVSILTDCPHRERLGWLEETHLNGPSLRYGFDLNRLFAKITSDMADSQTGGGLVPSIAPEYAKFGGNTPDERNDFGDSPEWGSAFLLVPWQQYEFTGDLSLLARHYEAMKRYVGHLTGRAQNHLVSYGLGDWYDIGPNPPGYAQLTPPALTATAFYYQDARILAQTAALLHRPDDQQRYQTLAEEIKTAFNEKFWNADTRQYANGSQCASSIPLVMGLAEPTSRQAILDHIVEDVQAKGLTAGDVGYRYLLQALSEGGRSDVIFAMNNQSDKPGYGYQLKQGATSLTEAWDARHSSSQNHFMLGQIMEWFYGGLAGIQPDPSGPGFQKIIIKPSPVGDITWVQAHYDSVRGPIVSEWTKTDHEFTLTVSIPPNTTATVYVPSFAPDTANTVAVYHVGSGQHRFVSR